MSAHDFDDKCTRMRGRRRLYVVNRLADSVQSGGGTNSHICHGHVIVNRTDQADDPEMAICLCLLLCDFILVKQLLDETGPFGPKDVRASEGAVSSANAECVDALLDEVERGGETTLGGAEGN